jgi:hypothetical protein
MKERPILFSAPMVRAILDGTKTQTRRVLVKQPLDIIPMKGKMTGVQWVGLTKRQPDPKGLVFRCRLGVPGDRLWVRETWRVGAWNEEEGLISVDYLANNCARREWLSVGDGELFERLWIQSSDDASDAGLKCGDEGYKWKPGESPCRWRPSIFMSRWASRITLEVTCVRVERLQEISEEDAKAEGITAPMYPPGNGKATYRLAYLHLWDSLNAKRGFGWDKNPWVWAITFRKVT